MLKGELETRTKEMNEKMEQVQQQVRKGFKKLVAARVTHFMV